MLRAYTRDYRRRLIISCGRRPGCANWRLIIFYAKLITTVHYKIKNNNNF